MEAAESTAAPLALGRGWKRGRLVVVALPLLVVFVALGSLGTVYYLRGFWLYRGFPPPHDPAFVVSRGTALQIEVPSAALGGRSQQVDVYLPPGYASHPRRRYPVLYLLHGFPGRPGAFLSTVKEGVNEDVLVALHRMQPLILVMPYGSTGTFTDKEWANGVRPKEAWETFVARVVVHAVDARFRTIRRGAGRAIGGLSEGGYGAINIALHHPRVPGRRELVRVRARRSACVDLRPRQGAPRLEQPARQAAEGGLRAARAAHLHVVLRRLGRRRADAGAEHRLRHGAREVPDPPLVRRHPRRAQLGCLASAWRERAARRGGAPRAWLGGSSTAC